MTSNKCRSRSNCGAARKPLSHGLPPCARAIGHTDWGCALVAGQSKSSANCNSMEAPCLKLQLRLQCLHLQCTHLQCLRLDYPGQLCKLWLLRGIWVTRCSQHCRVPLQARILLGHQCTLCRCRGRCLTRWECCLVARGALRGSQHGLSRSALRRCSLQRCPWASAPLRTSCQWIRSSTVLFRGQCSRRQRQGIRMPTRGSSPGSVLSSGSQTVAQGSET